MGGQEHDTSLQHAKSVLPSKHNCLIEPVTYKTAFEPRIPNTKDKDQENGGPSSRATGLQQSKAHHLIICCRLISFRCVRDYSSVGE